MEAVTLGWVIFAVFAIILVALVGFALIELLYDEGDDDIE